MSPTPLVMFSYGLIETTVIFLFCLAFLGIPWRLRPLATVVIPSVALVWLSRSLNLPFGLHTILLAALCGLLLAAVYHVQIPRALTASALGMFVLLVYEYLGTMGVSTLFAFTTEEMLNNQYLWLLTGLPHIILFLATSFLLRYLVKAKKP